MEKTKRQIDGGEFVSLITDHQREIYAYILALVPNRNDADDILQETTAFMWKRKDDFTRGTDFVAWGARIAYYKVLDHRKRIARNRRVIINDDQFKNFGSKALEESKHVKEAVYKLEECVKKLPNTDKHMVHLKYFSELSAKDISSRINKSVRSVYLSLARIQGLLLRCIERSA